MSPSIVKKTTGKIYFKTANIGTQLDSTELRIVLLVRTKILLRPKK